MNWKLFAKSTRPANRHLPPPGGVRHRPNLEVLEGRTVPSLVSFHIVQDQHPLYLSGTIGGGDIQPQGPPSLSTTYFGDFQADVDLANGSIRFIGTGNDFCSADSGNWAPLADGSDGNAPAAYGFQADVKEGAVLAAIRDFHWEVDTGGAALPLYQNDDGSFGFASSQALAIHQGQIAYSHPTLGYGSASLGGLNGPNQAADGSLYDLGGGTLSVVIPVSFSVSGTTGGVDYTLNFDGTMAGTGNYTGPTPGGRTHNGDATIGVALASGPHSLWAALPAAGAGSHHPASESPRGVATATAALPLQDVRPGDPVARAAHHALPAALDQFTALDSVFQGLAWFAV
jgi:hypothetical protein